MLLGILVFCSMITSCAIGFAMGLIHAKTYEMKLRMRDRSRFNDWH